MPFGKRAGSFSQVMASRKSAAEASACAIAAVVSSASFAQAAMSLPPIVMTTSVRFGSTAFGKHLAISPWPIRRSSIRAPHLAQSATSTVPKRFATSSATSVRKIWVGRFGGVPSVTESPRNTSRSTRAMSWWWVPAQLGWMMGWNWS